LTGLAFRNVSVHAGGRPLLESATLELEAGRFMALVGPNGAGKTTLLRAGLGLLPLAQGEIHIDDTPLGSLTERARAGKLAWLPQSALPAEALPAREAVMAARYRFEETRLATRDAAERALERVGLASRSGALLNTLSGGERQRVAIAALLAQEALYLLLDEPANHLDPAQQAETYALLGSLVSDGVGILCVTHDVNLLSHAGGSPRVLGLATARLRFDLPYDARELPERLSELFGVRMLALPVGAARVIVPAPRVTEEAAP